MESLRCYGYIILGKFIMILDVGRQRMEFITILDFGKIEDEKELLKCRGRDEGGRVFQKIVYIKKFRIKRGCLFKSYRNYSWIIYFLQFNYIDYSWIIYILNFFFIYRF